MIKNASVFFNQVILPEIKTSGFLVENMSVMILGSVGLGIDDEYSDFEAGVFLDDPIWKKNGASLQLALNRVLEMNNPWQKRGSVFSVQPLSWLLDGQAIPLLNAIRLDNKKQLDEIVNNISIETLFIMQNNIICHDPKNLLSNMRDNLKSSNMQMSYWSQKLIIAIHNLLEDLSEFKRTVIRNSYHESSIIYGCLLEKFYHVVFLCLGEYYPWRTHLNWAFAKIQTNEFSQELNSMVDALDWKIKVEKADNLLEIILNYISSKQLLPMINVHADDLVEEFNWAERLKAWENPYWKERNDILRRKAKDAGFDGSDFWVWSLWDIQDK
jgi:hypothetical protein